MYIEKPIRVGQSSVKDCALFKKNVAISLAVKRPEREADHSRPFSAEVKECLELYLHSPNTPSWRGAQLKAQGQLYKGV
jgi:hypothetical protein